ncbi:restriction endonuclease subunit S [Vreelandella lionensis]|uniref:Restriction endonuclease subunit S n=1 Tax=Vreelandella lionensis TaxID=1144478 RepID=A0ABW8BVL1_9GAMM
MSARELITEHLDLWSGAVTKKSSSGRGSKGKVELTGVKKLRELILELAVRGKLVEQGIPTESSPNLVALMEQEKSRLVASGRIKKPKAVCSTQLESYPFDIPKAWGWYSLGALGYTQTGSTPSKSQNELFGSDIPFLKPGDISDNGDIFYENEGLSEAGKATLGKWAEKGSILMVCIGTIGKCGLIEQQCTFNQQINSVTPYIPEVSRFLMLCLKSPYFQAAAWEKSSSTTISILNKGKWESIPVPLPPLEEQHRIVQKVDELMALCDRLEQQTSDQLEAHETLVDTLLGTLTQSENATELADNWARLAAHFDTLFTTEQSIDKLKQTILQLAVMGRLVEQDDEDEPASHLLKCIDKEIGQRVSEGTIRKPKALAMVEGSFPYDLPKGWRWEKLGRFTLIGTGATPSRGRPDYYSPPEYPWVTSGETSQAFICDTKERVSSLAVKETNISIYPAGTLIVAMYGQGKTRGQITELKVAAGTNQACAAIQPIIKDESHRRYIKLCFIKLYDEIREVAAGGAQPNLNTGKIANTLIPLPPLTEQNRIVQKVDELMALCDQLKERINQASETRCQLAEAVVEKGLSA